MLALIAQSPPINSEWIWIGAVVAVLMALATAINHITATVERFKSKPPVHELYATKNELTQFDIRIRDEIQAADNRSEKRAKANCDLIYSQTAQIERVLSDKISDNKTNHTEQFGFLRGELHAMRGTMQSLSNEISRAVGRLEGRNEE